MDRAISAVQGSRASRSTASAAETGMPTRVLGKTGARVSILTYGCGTSFSIG